MFKLVRFLGDDVHYVCKDVHHNHNTKTVKWRNNYYAAELIAASDNEIILKDLCYNINNFFPSVSICRINPSQVLSSPSQENSTIENLPPTHEEVELLEYILNTDLPIEFIFDPIGETDVNAKNPDVPLSETINEPLNIPDDVSKSVNSIHTENVESSDVLCIPLSETINEPFNIPASIPDDVSNSINNIHTKTVESSDVFCIPKDLRVSVSKIGKKQYYCNYCSKTVTNFGRHLVTIHKNKPEVSSILKYPKGHPERKNKITSIRNAAQHIHNVDLGINTGNIIVSRRPSENKHRNATHYRVCPNCKQMFSKLSLRVHFNKCSKEKQGARGILFRSKQFQMYAHENASERLVKFVLAHCREDEVAEEIMYDDLCIKFGNKLCKKYRGQQHSNMIRTRLRELGKFIMEVKKLDGSVKNLSDILVPGNYDNIVIAINKVAGFDETSGMYRAPSTAYNLGLHIKTVTTLLRSEYIKAGNSEMRTKANDLLCLMNEGFQTDINKIVNENQCQKKRHKKILLPTAADINALNCFLKKGMKKEYSSLKINFTREAWKNLAGYTLICLQLFNRKRAGELERILIEDYNNYQFLDVDDNLFKNLEEKMKNLGQKYARFFIRGKLNRKVSVLISREHIDCIELILKYREQYGVSPNNPYVFGTVGKQYFLRACHLMRYYSVRCGAPNPNRLRGTELRKQIATACKMYNLPDLLIEDVANHLGHDISIHKTIYRQSLGTEVPAIADILLKAMGSNIDESDDDECTNDCSDTSKREEPLISSDCSLAAQKIQQESPLPSPSSYATRISQEEISLPSPSCSFLRKNPEEYTNQTKDIGDKPKRTSWTTEEINAVRKSFEGHIDIGIVPTFEECHEARSKYTCLKNRTPPQIKSFVIHQTKKKYSTPNAKGKKTWTELEKMVVKKEFSIYLKEKKLPSLPYCSKIIAANPVLNGRTPVVLKAFINNINKKLKINS